MAFCSQCGTDVAGGKFCPKCGAAVAERATGSAPTFEGTNTAGGGQGTSGAQPPGETYASHQATSAAGAGISDNVAGLLAYITIIPAIIFLLADPFKRNRFVRFHSFQCLFFAGASLCLFVVLSILSIALSFVGVGLLIGLLTLVLQLGMFAVWILLVIKAYQGQMYKLPVIGDLAEKQALKI
jgi:uncharacterized membrane protein